MHSIIMMKQRQDKNVRVRYETWMSLRALRRYAQETDDTLDSVIQRLITFYVNKPTELKRKVKGGGKGTE